jgi:DNA-binding transcriptional ArsR family regulator
MNMHMPTPHEPRLARVAAMIADPARSRMLAYLLDGSYASASELAAAASITAQTASGHLRKLQDIGFVVCEPRGRHRYFKLADAEVAHALEALAMVAERNSHDRTWASPARQKLRYARCCYGHLAGALGVALCDTLMQHKRLKENSAGDFELTTAGESHLAALGFIPNAALNTTRKVRLAYPCLDWSERRDHLAGSLSASLLNHFITQAWLKRPAPREAERSGKRILSVTPSGKRELLPWLGLD